MRFSAIHKASTYLVAISAYLALVLSNEFGIVIPVVGGAAIAASWFWEPPRVRPERWTFLWNAVGVGVFAFQLLSLFGGENVVVAFGRVVIYLLVAKLFGRVGSRDYLWIYVLAFSMLVAASALNGNLSYAVCFLGFVVSATWALILFHLRRDMEDNFLLKHSDDSSSEKVEVERILHSRRIVGPSFLFGTSLVSLAIFAGALTLFVLFPRVGFGLFFEKSRSGLTMAGFRDGVTLGGHGLIRTDDTVVLRVFVDDPKLRGARAPAIHWRGVAFDRYSLGTWSRSEKAPPTRFATQHFGRNSRIYLAGRADPKLLSGALRQEIYLEPLDASVLFGASRPVAFEIASPLSGARAARGVVHPNEEVRFPHSSGIKYVVWSDTRPPDEARLRAAPDADPEAMATYLQIPPEMPDRVRALAREITAGARGPYEKALSVERYLRRNFAYTLRLEEAPGREPLDYFLFDRRRGHCEYFSSAMAILLRAVGVPTRNVNGFLGGEWNEYGGYIAVRSGDAHSWVEVWFDGVGWVTFDPTPPGVAAPLRRGGGNLLERMRRMLDTMRLKWFQWVLEYDLGRQVGLLRWAGEWLGLGAGGGRRPTTGAAFAWAREHARELGAAASGVALLGVGLAWWRRRRARAPGATGRRARSSHPVVATWRKSSARLARAGYARPPSHTPREHAAALLEAGAPGAEAFARLTELYYRARYADGSALAPSPDLETARRLADEIASAIRSRGRRAA